jgi:hypothetical protein
MNLGGTLLDMLHEFAFVFLRLLHLASQGGRKRLVDENVDSELIGPGGRGKGEYVESNNASLVKTGGC